VGEREEMDDKGFHFAQEDPTSLPSLSKRLSSERFVSVPSPGKLAEYLRHT
jgi:hypothetical protein